MLLKKNYILVRAGNSYKMLMKSGSCADCIYCHDFFQCRQILLPDPNDTTKLTSLETICNSYPGYVPIFARKRKRNL